MSRTSPSGRPLGHRLWWAAPLLVAVLALVIGLTGDPGGDGFIYMMLVLAPLFAFLAAVIGTRVPGNPIAWLLLSIGASVPVAGVASLAIPATPPDTPTFWLAVAVFLVDGVWIFFIFPLLLILMLFPTGSFLTPRWRWGGWLAATMVVIFCLVAVFGDELVSSAGWSVRNPIGFIPQAIWEGWFSVLWSAGLAFLAVGGLASMVGRYRRSAVLVRTQIRWFVFPAVVFAVGFAVSAVIADDAAVTTTAWNVAFGVGFALIPVSITIAITRFRLYDIDRIVSRTVTYTLVIGLLLAVYVGATVLSTAILPVDSDLGVAVSTLTAAALFTPLRRGIQRRIDRRFNRSRYIAQQEMDSFTGKLRDTTDLAGLHAELGGIIQRTLQPASIGIWIRGRA